MLVAILPALLDEDQLVDAGVLERLEVRAELVRRADAASAARFRELWPGLLEALPDVGPPGSVIAEDIVVPEGVAEEAEAVFAAPPRFLRILVAGRCYL